MILLLLRCPLLSWIFLPLSSSPSIFLLSLTDYSRCNLASFAFLLQQHLQILLHLRRSLPATFFASSLQLHSSCPDFAASFFLSLTHALSLLLLSHSRSLPPVSASSCLKSDEKVSKLNCQATLAGIGREMLMMFLFSFVICFLSVINNTLSSSPSPSATPSFSTSPSTNFTEANSKTKNFTNTNHEVLGNQWRPKIPSQEDLVVQQWVQMEQGVRKGIQSLLSSFFPHVISSMSSDPKVSANCSDAILKLIISLGHLREWAVKSE